MRFCKGYEFKQQYRHNIRKNKRIKSHIAVEKEYQKMVINVDNQTTIFYIIIYVLFLNLYNSYIISTQTMSNFFAQGNASDDSDSQDDKKNVNDAKNRKKFEVEDDDYRDDQKGRIKQSQADKKNAIFNKLSSTAITAVYNKDFDKAWDTLQQMLKQIEKSTKFIQTAGLPSSFLRALKIIEAQVNGMDAEARKSLKNPKSFNILRQKLKNKILPQYKEKLQNFKDQPEPSPQSQTKKEGKKKDSDEDQNSLISSDDESQEQIYKKYLHSEDPSIRRRYWLKRDVKHHKSQDEQKPKKQREEDNHEKEKEKEGQGQGLDGRPNQPSKKKKFNLIQQKKKRQQTIIASAKEAEAKIGKILKQFAKISTSQKRQQYMSALNSILNKSKQYKDFEQLSLLLVDIPIRLEVTRQVTREIGQTHFLRENWNQIFDNVTAIFKLLRESEDQDLMEKIATFEERSEQATYGTTQKAVYSQIVSFVNSLERQLDKSLDFLQSSQLQYSERLQDLVRFIEFLYRVSKQLAFKEQLEQEAAKISFNVLENMYFMSNLFMDKIKKSSLTELTFIELSDQNVLEEYIKPILKLKDQDYTTKTLLYLIYNHAVNRRDKAKDLLVMTDISQTISTRDYYTQVCFNRALVQLGISSFHHGNLYETQQILSSICSLGKSREENKQNIKRFLGQMKSTDREIVKHKTLPYYLHLNIDLIEAIELIAAMILEVPFTLTEGGRITSKSFKKVAYQYERSHFIAEPLNYRDLVFAASNELKLGNMNECLEKLKQIDIWNELGNSDEALENLKINIKQTALKCYILANRNCFKCLSLERLAKKFEMEEKAARKIICRQINERKILGAITSDGYLNLAEKREQKQSGLRSINNNLSAKLEELNRANQQIFKQRQQSTVEDEEQIDREPKVVRKLVDAMTEKYRNILSRRV